MLAHPAGPVHIFFEPLLQAADLLPQTVQLVFILNLLLQQRSCLNLHGNKIKLSACSSLPDAS
jgi:hypothetical protein